MRQRHLRVCFVLWVFAFFGTIAAAWFTMPRRAKFVFVDPVIWREPWTDDQPQLQPEI